MAIMQEIISNLIGSDMVYMAVLGVVFVGVLALLFGMRYLLASHANVIQDRLRRTVGATALASSQDADAGLAPPPTEGASILQQALSTFSQIGRPASEEEMGRLRRRFTQAGYRGELALVTYLSVKILLCLVGGGVVLWVNTLQGQPLEYMALYTVLAMIAGFYLPNYWLHSRVQNRQREINHALPDALDLVVTCVEAGLGLDAALERVSKEMQLSSSLLSSELALTSLEMRAGMPRGEAFRRLANRTGVEELQNLAAIIIQTDIFGTSVARSLRVQADAMRIRRTQLAEERAATVGVKLTIPLIFCILPSLFAVLMGPAVVRIIRILLPTLHGKGG